MEDNRNLINALIKKAGSGDNEAWTELYHQYERYVHKRAWSRLSVSDISDKEHAEEDLFSVGWIGFISALKNYDEEKGDFTAYATWYIDGEIKKEHERLVSMGIGSKPVGEMIKRLWAKDNSEESYEAFNDMLSKAAEKMNPQGSSAGAPVEKGEFTAERRTLQILEVLRLMTDEDHSISCARLQELLTLYRRVRHKNDASIESSNTFNKSMAEILMELDPLRHTAENDDLYRIRYEGYETDRLAEKVKMQKDNPVKVETGVVFNGLKYVHDFDGDTLDRLIQVISFSDMFSNEEKTKLIKKLISTMSVYYDTPFMDENGLKFNPTAIHGRFSNRRNTDRKQFADNLKILQSAINSLAQIHFRFNCYTEDHEMIPKNDRLYTLSPYHIVVYHDNYYVIGLDQDRNNRRILHYRVDLMSDIEIIRDEEGKIRPIEVCAFEGLPICNSCFDPGEYMAEHLNMAYDDPEDIRIRIKNADHTILHDWFGDNYSVEETAMIKDESGQEIRYDTVVVKTSPFMIVHWAMQYGCNVEILDEKLREDIREELKEMSELYGD
ncbi:MAG: WYL domain-containing protein [Lachnospiraceae bacterium]|nr:WYL domain-containing protein [Lachnospiraceae bacterium]